MRNSLSIIWNQVTAFVCFFTLGCQLHASPIAIPEVPDLDPNLASFTGTPNSIGVNSTGDFFIVNSNTIGGGAGDVIGWKFTSATNVLMEVHDAFFSDVSSPTGFPINVAVNNADDFFIANAGGTLTGVGNDVIIGWKFTSATNNLMEASDPLVGSTTINPSSIAANSENDFFIINQDTIGTGGGGDSNIVGWKFSSENIISEYTDSLGIETATPSIIAVNPAGDFFIANGDSIGTLGSNASNIVGWKYDLGTDTLTEYSDNTISNTAQPLAISVNNITGDFIIVNGATIGSGGTSDIVGWQFDSITNILTDILDNLGANTAMPFAIAVNNSGIFFITNRDSISNAGDSQIVGWRFDSGLSLLTRVFYDLGSNIAVPGNVAVNNSGDFFIVNTDSIGTGGGGDSNIVGWKYEPVTNLLTPAFDDLGSNIAFPSGIAVNNSGDFFIVNGDTINSGGDSQIVGWKFDSVTNGLTQFSDDLVIDPSIPTSIAVNSAGDFFIVNNSTIDSVGSGDIVGWKFTSTTNTLTEVTDPLLADNVALPLNISVNNNGDFFIVNSNLIGNGGQGNIVGWILDAPIPPTPSSNINPPVDLMGKQIKNRFLTQTDIVNIITFSAPVSGLTPVAYRIFRDLELTDLAATVSANGKLKFEDHNRKKGKVYTYYIVSVAANGQTSPSVQITVK